MTTHWRPSRFISPAHPSDGVKYLGCQVNPSVTYIDEQFCMLRNAFVVGLELAFSHVT